MISTSDTLIGYVQRHAQERPEALYARYLFPDREAAEMTYRQLEQDTRRFANLYASNGVEAGSVVLVILQHHEDLMPAFLGAMWLGAVPAFLPFPTARLDAERYYANLHGLLQHTQPRAVLTYPELQEALQQVSRPQPQRPVVLVADDAAAQPLYGDPLPHSAEDVALIQFSSGSTGLQKGAALSHRAILAEMQGVGDFFELTARDSMLSWVPLYHDWGLVCVALHALQLGTHYTLLSPMHWLMRPVVAFEAIHRYRPSVYYQPNFAFNYMTQRVQEAEMEGLDLSSLRICCNGAEPCFYDSHTMFAERFRRWGFRPESLAIVYGMAEVTNSVFAAGHNEPITVDCIDRKVLQEKHRAQPVPPDDPNVMRMLGVGRALTGTTFTIFDDHRNACPERSVGEVAIKSRAHFHGYYRNPAATAQTDCEGWYLTGDLGYRVGHTLFITGRKSDVIIVSGVNVYPQDIENIVAEHPAVVTGRVAAIGMLDPALGTERLVVIAESRATEPAVLRAIAHHTRSQVRQRLGVVVDQIYHAPYRWLIKTSSGKIARTPNSERLSELASRIG